MAESNYSSDVLFEIEPLKKEIDYELRFKGVHSMDSIQPAQAPTTKRVQLAR